MFNENLVGVYLAKGQVKLNKPIYIGQNILDETKLLMNDFHYNKFLPKFNRKNIDVMYTDTDSIIYHIRNEDPFQILAGNKIDFDLSNYSPENKLFDKTNKKVIRKMKNESPNEQIKEFCALKPKQYAFITDDNEEHKKAKGTKRNVIEKGLLFENYKISSFNRQTKNNIQKNFISKKHQLYTIETDKISLNYADDKCYIKNNNIECLTFGHYKTIQ